MVSERPQRDEIQSGHWSESTITVLVAVGAGVSRVTEGRLRGTQKWKKRRVLLVVR